MAGKRGNDGHGGRRLDMMISRHAWLLAGESSRPAPTHQEIVHQEIVHQQIVKP